MPFLPGIIHCFQLSGLLGYLRIKKKIIIFTYYKNDNHLKCLPSFFMWSDMFWLLSSHALVSVEEFTLQYNHTRYNSEFHTVPHFRELQLLSTKRLWTSVYWQLTILFYNNLSSKTCEMTCLHLFIFIWISSLRTFLAD